MTYDLEERSKELFKFNPHLQQSWIKAIDYLRTQSKRGWILDSSGVKTVQQ